VSGKYTPGGRRREDVEPVGSMLEIMALNPVLEALEDGVCTVDPEWRVTYWNAAAERLLGISRGAAVGRALHEVLPPGEPGVRESLRRAMELREARHFSETRPAGPCLLRLEVHAAPLEGGGIVIHFRDATGEHTRAEEYTRLVEAMRDGFVAVDAAWRVVYVNGAAEALLRLSRSRALGSDLRALLPSGPPELGEALRDSMRDGVPRHLSGVRPHGRVFGERFFDLWTCPLPSGGLSILFEDVTGHVQRERMLARLAAEAEEANRAKSRFFAAVSHELRTPLNAIVGYTHLLTTDAYGSTPAGARRAAERAGVCAEHLSRLVDDVLMVTTAEIGRLPVSRSPVALERFLSDTLEPLRQQAEAKRLGFRVEVAEEAAEVETDPDRLRQLLVALVGNAVKFTPRGEVRVRTRAVRSREGEEWVEIAVEDTGPGIAPEHRELIFDAFEQLGDPSRTDSMRRGTGFGLTIARKLAELLRGSLTVEGGEAGGSVFRLRLRRRSPAPPAPA
jgi:PAS domain S-box-containing protein